MISEDLKKLIEHLDPEDLAALRKHLNMLEAVRDPEFKRKMSEIRESTRDSDRVSIEEFAEIAKSSQ